jgi:hypothetical protein
MTTTPIQPLWRNVLLWAGASVAIDILFLAASAAVWHFSGSPNQFAHSAWLSFHEPAILVASALLPGLASAHGSLPLVSYVGCWALALAQTAIPGGVLGYVYTVVRKKQRDLERR